MKIIPKTQTLILASDRRGAASKAGATGSALSRVTIVATQSDASVVYLRADYSPGAADASGGSSNYGGGASVASRSSVAGVSSAGTAVAVRPQTSIGIASTPAGSASRSFSATSSFSYLNSQPTEQYAFTQAILAAAPTVRHIDVYA